jgi:hypothetical protein
MESTFRERIEMLERSVTRRRHFGTVGKGSQIAGLVRAGDFAEVMAQAVSVQAEPFDVGDDLVDLHIPRTERLIAGGERTW